jgi:hypothetical protein
MPTEGDHLQQSFVSRFGQAALQEAAKAMDAKWQQLEDRVAKQAGRVLQYFRTSEARGVENICVS